MKRLLLALLSMAMPLAATAADTAYSALRIVGKRSGEDSLGRVLEVRGRFGAPEPAVWKVVVADQGSRGGVREYEVERGRISGERAPSGRPSGAPLDLNRLNIDSEGAFTIINEECKKAAVPFDRVDYVLNSGSRGGVPTWHIEIFNGRDGRVGTMEIAADTGNVSNRQLTAKNRNTTAEDRAYLRENPGPDDRRRTTTVERRREYVDVPREDRRDYEEDRVYDERDYEDVEEYRDDRRHPDDRRVYVEEEGPGITDLFGKIDRHFKRRGKQIKNFFTR